MDKRHYCFNCGEDIGRWDRFSDSHDNPDDGPRCAIYCEGPWAQGLPHNEGMYPCQLFFGESVLDCLRTARAALAKYDAAKGEQ